MARSIRPVSFTAVLVELGAGGFRHGQRDGDLHPRASGCRARTWAMGDNPVRRQTLERQGRGWDAGSGVRLRASCEAPPTGPPLRLPSGRGRHEGTDPSEAPPELRPLTSYYH